MKFVYTLIITCFVITQTMVAQTSPQKKDSTVNYKDITGKKQGYWCKRDAAGNKVYEGYFKNDVPVGQFKKYHANGQLKYLQVYNEQNPSQVEVTMYDITGDLIGKGTYVDKQKHGEWLYYSANKSVLLKENYIMGKLEGEATVFWQVGEKKPAEIKNWKNNMKHGGWFWFYEDGKIRMKAAYVENKMHGDFIVYFADGKIHIQGEYINDKRHGKWMYYNTDGTVRSQIVYNNGEIVNEDEAAAIETKKLNNYLKDFPSFNEPSMKDTGNSNTTKTEYPKDPEDPQNFVNDPEAYIFKSEAPNTDVKADKKKKSSKKPSPDKNN